MGQSSSQEKLCIGSGDAVTNVIDENGDVVTNLYKNLVNYLISNPKFSSRQFLRWWEIRSWVHFNDPQMINNSGTDWGHHSHEPLLGIGKANDNPLFEWAKSIKSKWNKGLIFDSYLFPSQKYKLLKKLHQGTSLCSAYTKPDDSNNYSTGYIAENVTDNEDGFAGKVLYICFRETTGPLQFAHWVSGMFATVDPSQYSGNEDLPSMTISRGIWNGPYTSGSSGEGAKNIRNSLLSFMKKQDMDKYDTIIITGMSLGGAMAQCATLDVASRVGPGKVKLIPYAAPRVYTESVVNYLTYNRKVKVLRIEGDQLDNVSGFPYSAGYMPPVWRHAGVAVRIAVDQNEMVLKAQTKEEKLKTQIMDEDCVFYFSGVILGDRLPGRLVLGAGKTYNFHTRPNYFKYLYYFAMKYGNELTNI
jgi:hypothetical protein